MKIEDLIPSLYYYIEENNTFYIFKYVKQSKHFNGGLDEDRVDADYGLGDMNGGLVFYKNNANAFVTGRNLREASYEEKLWLETCIKEDKLVPKEEINTNYYEIY
jgi:hypothetical protein